MGVFWLISSFSLFWWGVDLNATIKREISLGIFSIFKVGSKELVISHLQYADDTILLGEAIMDNCGLLRFFLGVLS